MHIVQRKTNSIPAHWALRPIGEAILWKNILFLAAKLTSSLQLTRHVFIKLAQWHINSYSSGSMSHRGANIILCVLYGRPHSRLKPLRHAVLKSSMLACDKSHKQLPQKLQQKLCISSSLVNGSHFQKLHTKSFNFPLTEFLRLRISRVQKSHDLNEYSE